MRPLWIVIDNHGEPVDRTASAHKNDALASFTGFSGNGKKKNPLPDGYEIREFRLVPSGPMPTRKAPRQ